MNLKNLNFEIMACQECSGTPRELGWGATEKIMFIGQCPSITNIQGSAGNSNFDKFFIPLLLEAGVKEDDFYFTNIVKFYCAEITENELNHGGKHLKKEIELVKPKIIICLGRFASSWASQKELKVESLIHPAAMRYGTITRQQWINSLTQVLKKYGL